MNRRTMLRVASATCLALSVFASCGRGPEPVDEPAPDEQGWRKVRFSTQITVPDATGVTRAWIPLPRSAATDHQRASAPSWDGNATVTEVYIDAKTGAELLYAEWPATESAPTLVVTSEVELRDRAVDLTAPASAPALSDAERSLYLASTPLMPLDGIVRSTALEIVGDEVDDVAKARALYEWIVDNAYRDPETVGCGTGDIVEMLETGDLGGKCVDINALFIGLARSVGIPARHDYGVRVTMSATYDSLGKEGDVTKGQHCRAEFWSADHGWVPVDPADVRKLVLEEDGGLTLDDPVVQQARVDFFGKAEMNWVVYNHAENIELPNSGLGAMPFLMYPQVMVDGQLCDCYLPETCRYTLESTAL